MNSPTLTAQATQLGIILGTAAHGAGTGQRQRRSPRGHLGFRRRALRNAHRPAWGMKPRMSDTLAAVLTRDVDWKALPTDVPPDCSRCCATASARSEAATPRYRRRTSRARSDHRRRADPAAVIASAHRRRDPRVCSSAAMGRGGRCAGGAAALAFVHFRETPRHSKASDSRYLLLTNLRSLHSRSLQTAVYLAFATGGGFFGVQGGMSKLWLRPIDSLDARAVPGTKEPPFKPILLVPGQRVHRLRLTKTGN